MREPLRSQESNAKHVQQAATPGSTCQEAALEILHQTLSNASHVPHHVTQASTRLGRVQAEGLQMRLSVSSAALFAQPISTWLGTAPQAMAGRIFSAWTVRVARRENIR